MNNESIKINIELTPTNDGWYAEATAAYPEAKIITTSCYGLEETLQQLSWKIEEWISTWPEHLRPGYKLPVFLPGVLVKHTGLPETVFLEIVDGPFPSAVSPAVTNLYHIKMPSGEIAIAKGENLRGPKEEINETDTTQPE